jgi:hypothetical protein
MPIETLQRADHHQCLKQEPTKGAKRLIGMRMKLVFIILFAERNAADHKKDNMQGTTSAINAP